MPTPNWKFVAGFAIVFGFLPLVGFALDISAWLMPAPPPAEVYLPVKVVSLDHLSPVGYGDVYMVIGAADGNQYGSTITGMKKFLEVDSLEKRFESVSSSTERCSRRERAALVRTAGALVLCASVQSYDHFCPGLRFALGVTAPGMLWLRKQRVVCVWFNLFVTVSAMGIGAAIGCVLVFFRAIYYGYLK